MRGGSRSLSWHFGGGLIHPAAHDGSPLGQQPRYSGGDIIGHWNDLRSHACWHAIARQKGHIGELYFSRAESVIIAVPLTHRPTNGCVPLSPYNTVVPLLARQFSQLQVLGSCHENTGLPPGTLLLARIFPGRQGLVQVMFCLCDKNESSTQE